MYESPFYTSIFHASVLTLTMLSCEVLTILVFSKYVNIDFNTATDSPVTFLILIILSKILYFFIVKLILHFIATKNFLLKKNSKESFILLLVPISILYILLTIGVVSITFDLTNKLKLMLLTSCILLLTLNFIVYSLFYYISNRNRKYTKLEVQLQHDNDMLSYYKDLLKHDENQKILIHDIKTHLESLAILNSTQNHDGVSKYIQKISNMDILQPSIRICNHDLLNVILYRYQTKAKENDIQFYIDIRNNSLQFVHHDDITSLFCNLLNNSLEAAKNISNSYIELSVTQAENNCNTTISLINSCRINPFCHDGKTLISKKSNPHRHGLGLKSIDKIVKEYDGLINRYYQNETHTFHTTIIFSYINVYGNLKFRLP